VFFYQSLLVISILPGPGFAVPNPDRILIRIKVLLRKKFRLFTVLKNYDKKRPKFFLPKKTDDQAPGEASILVENDFLLFLFLENRFGLSGSGPESETLVSTNLSSFGKYIK
jgi:hypothetical protein